MIIVNACRGRVATFQAGRITINHLEASLLDTQMGMFVWERILQQEEAAQLSGIIIAMETAKM